jgi:hypothetical protein
VTVLAVEIGKLVDVIWVGLVAGVGITAAYSFVVLGTGGYAEARRAGRGGFGWAALAVIALSVFVAGVVLGVKIMLSK